MPLDMHHAPRKAAALSLMTSSAHLLRCVRMSAACIACIASAAAISFAGAQSAADFTQRIEVRPPQGTPIARVALSAASIAALRTPDGGDLRVFNAAGQMLPYAVINAASEPRARPDRAGERIVALPIYAEVSTTASTPTLRIEDGPNGRVIEYSATGGTAKPGPAKTPRGLLFDTRKIDEELRAVELEGALPSGIIVKINLDASEDLKSWQRLASDAPVYDFRADDNSPVAAAVFPSSRRITLPAAFNPKTRVLRLTWTSSEPPGIVALRSISAGEVAAPASITIDAGAPTSASDDAMEWALPSGLRFAANRAAPALRLQTSAPNTLMPVTISTRARAGEPWRVVAGTVVYRMESSNPALTPYAPLETQLRVEPMRGYSLKGIPLTLALDYPPLQVLFVASGDGPFTVATGKAGLASAALPLATLLPGYQTGAEFALPVLQPVLGSEGAAQPAPSPRSSADALGEYVGRSTLLWGVLLLAVAVLAGLAISLLRAPKR